MRHPGKILTGAGDRYPLVRLCRSGVRKTYAIHVLVAQAFHGPPPFPGAYVLHRNDNGWDNRAENLYWGSASDNARDAVSNGRHRNAVKTHCPRGHPLEGSNLMISTRGSRRCRSCQLTHLVVSNSRRGGREGITLTPAEFQERADRTFASLP